ncbi:MAG: hypothetical protein LBB49_04975 [Gracilibacteraceae bacterium]|jgi:hypothetical protein|nr:hypothetical protein [Gracilibacteraceae bacterium]
MEKRKKRAAEIWNKFLDKFIDRILTVVISVVIVPWIMSLMGMLSLAGMFSLIDIPEAFYWPILFSALFIITISVSVILFIILYKKLQRIYKKYEFQFRYEFKFGLFESELNFPISGDYITQNIHFTYRVLCDKLNSLPHCFVWTGGGIKSVQLDEETQEQGYALDLSRLNEKLSVIKINFPETKYRDDTGEVRFVLELERGDMEPCLSKRVFFQMDALTLRIRAPIGLIKNAESYARTSLENKEIRLDEGKLTKKESHPEIIEFELNEDDPILSYSYAIKWSFE